MRNAIYTVTVWFSVSWWKYLLEKPHHDTSRWTAFWCRAKGHPCGPIWYNVGGSEPDMRCQNCMDYIG